MPARVQVLTGAVVRALLTRAAATAPAHTDRHGRSHEHRRPHRRLLAFDADLAARLRADRDEIGRAAVGHELGAEGAPDRLDLALHLGAHLGRAVLELLEAAGGALELLLELQDAL